MGAIRTYATTADIVAALPGIQGSCLSSVDVSPCVQKLNDLAHWNTPHEKITCIDEAHSLLQTAVADGCRNGLSAGQPQQAAMEITGDDVLSLFIIVVHRCELPN